MTRPCPTCGAGVEEGAAQCPQCKQVFGEANRCDACGALAAAREEAEGRLVCAACGAPRSRLAGTVVLSTYGDSLKQQSRMALIWSWVLRLGAVGAGVFGAAVGGLQSLFDLGSPALTAGAFVAGAIGLFFLGGRQRAKSLRLQDVALTRQLLSEVGQLRQGVTAAGAAGALDAPVAEVDAQLEALAKRGEVEMDVDDEGTIRYRVAAHGFDVEGTELGEETAALTQARRRD